MHRREVDFLVRTFTKQMQFMFMLPGSISLLGSAVCSPFKCQEHAEHLQDLVSQGKLDGVLQLHGGSIMLIRSYVHWSQAWSLSAVIDTGLQSERAEPPGTCRNLLG